MIMGNCNKKVFSINGTKLENANEMKFLGLTIDKKLTLKKTHRDQDQQILPSNTATYKAGKITKQRTKNDFGEDQDTHLQMKC